MNERISFLVQFDLLGFEIEKEFYFKLGGKKKVFFLFTIFIIKKN